MGKEKFAPRSFVFVPAAGSPLRTRLCLHTVTSDTITGVNSRYRCTTRRCFPRWFTGMSAGPGSRFREGAPLSPEGSRSRAGSGAAPAGRCPAPPAPHTPPGRPRRAGAARAHLRPQEPSPRHRALPQGEFRTPWRRTKRAQLPPARSGLLRGCPGRQSRPARHRAAPSATAPQREGKAAPPGGAGSKMAPAVRGLKGSVWQSE